MKNKTISFFLLFITGITLLFYVLNRQTEAAYIQEKSDIESHFNRMNEYLNEELAQSFVPNIIIEDTLSQQYPLSDLVSQSPILIFRYTDIYCNPCFETELSLLRELFSNKKQQISILSSYRERRSFIFFKRDNRIELPFYRIPHDAFDWMLEDYGSPYYFVLHPDMTVSHIYIPDQVFPELNKQYLERVKNFLSD